MTVSVGGGIHLVVDDLSQAGAARRAAVALAQSMAMGEETTGRVAIVATELATNLARHARDGELIMRALGGDGDAGVELVAIDRAPGIDDVARALEDGYSTAGSAGDGLGAVKRLSSRFDIASRPGHGTVVWCQLWVSPPPPPSIEVGAISMPYPGEAHPGDAWAIRVADARVGLVVSDGLGHGPDAAAAAMESVRVFNDDGRAPAECLELMHRALAPTRGAAAARVELDLARRLVSWSSVGNVTGAIWAGGKARNLLAHAGTLGHSARKITEYSYPWPAGAVLVVATDGIGRVDLSSEPALLAHHPGVVAGAIYRDARRPKDDATVVVLRERAS